MYQSRGKKRSALLVSLFLLSATAARADFIENLRLGMSLFDYTSQINRNVLGNGWDFNAVTFYGGQSYDFGLAELTLGETSSSAVSIAAGYTLRGIPSANFSMQTSNPLSYTFNANYGFQDLVASGEILFNIDTTINALGFYDQVFQISNRGAFDTNGFIGDDAGTLDFDAGPIVVSGNIYADILAFVTQPFFTATGTENPFAKFSQQATKIVGLPANADELSARLAAGETLSADEMSQVVNNTIVSAVLGREPSADLFDDLMAPEVVLETSQSSSTFQMAIPEPATLTMLLLPLAFVIPRQRKS